MLEKKSFAKVNIYLKIIGIKDGYHLLNSRFMIVNSLYDTITFKKKSGPKDAFELSGKFSCKKEDNIIYKAYKALLRVDKISKKVENFFEEYSVNVQKNIPEFAGLGGGSSNAATFLKMANEAIELKLTKDELLNLASSLGADVAFFINEFESANVSGIGENVLKFDENTLELNIYTPPVKCVTKDVYATFRKELMKNYDKIISDNIKLATKLDTLKSKEILKDYAPTELNDLFAPAIKLYPKLQDYVDYGFFSGSGSSFFKELEA